MPPAVHPFSASASLPSFLTMKVASCWDIGAMLTGGTSLVEVWKQARQLMRRCVARYAKRRDWTSRLDNWWASIPSHRSKRWCWPSAVVSLAVLSSRPKRRARVATSHRMLCPLIRSPNIASVSKMPCSTHQARLYAPSAPARSKIRGYRSLLRVFLCNDMEHVPVFGRPIGDMTIHVFFLELYHLHPNKQPFCLLPRVEGQGTPRLIPLVMNAKQLAGKNSTRPYRSLHPCKDLVETVFRIKRESKVSVYQVVSLKGKILKRRLNEPQVLLR